MALRVLSACGLAMSLSVGAVAAPPEAAPASTKDRAAQLACDVATQVEGWARDLERLVRDEAALARAKYDAAVEAARKPNGVFVAPPHIQLRGEDLTTGAALGSSLAWRPVDQAWTTPPRELVLLVHGLDETGDVWDELTPALAARGVTIARFEYPNDQAIARSADALQAALQALRARGVERMSIVGFSMGGLVARDVLTRPSPQRAELPKIDRLITLGTPHAGSSWAHLQPVAEAIESLARVARTGKASSALSYLTDGDGAAAVDLLPGSAYLTELQSRGAIQDVKVTAIVGRWPIDAESEAALRERLATLVGSDASGKLVQKAFPALQVAAAKLGDGVVPVASAAWSKADEVIIVRAGHRGMISSTSPDSALRAAGVELDRTPAITLVLDRVAPQR